MSQVACTHIWSRWISIPTPFESTPDDGFVYRRECLMLGCNTFEECQELTPTTPCRRYNKPSTMKESLKIWPKECHEDS